jgi:hypothetical protein
MQEEIWKPIKGYEESYQISNLGRVRSLDRKNSLGREIKGKIMNMPIQSCGYRQVFLSKLGVKKSHRVHRLVAENFLDDENFYKKGYVVDHIDNDKLNNSLNNLQVITQRQNTSKDKKNGTSKYTGVIYDKDRCRWRSEIYINGKLKYIGRFKTEEEAHFAYQKQLLEVKFKEDEEI